MKIVAVYGTTDLSSDDPGEGENVAIVRMTDAEMGNADFDTTPLSSDELAAVKWMLDPDTERFPIYAE